MSWTPATQPPPSAFTAWLHDQIERLAAAHAAYEDMTMVRHLASNPWLLHYLTRQPEWAAYVAALRESQAR